MTASKHVLMLVYASIRDNPRVTNEARSLIDAGYKVTVIGAPREDYDPEPTLTTINEIKAILPPLITHVSFSELSSMLLRIIRCDLGEQTRPLVQQRNPIRTLLNLAIFWLWILRLCHAKRFDVVHSHDVFPLPVAWLLAQRFAAPLIFDTHEPWQYLYQHSKSIKNTLIGLINKTFLPRANAVIITSEPLREHIEAAGAKRIVNIANLKRKEAYTVEPSRIEEIRQQLQLDQFKLVISYIGFLFPHRGVVELVKAVAQLPDVGLIVAGRGDDTEEIKAIAKDAPNIIWLGWLPLSDVPAYTAASDAVYCWFPDTIAYQLSTPNKLFDAISAGKILIARKDVGEMSSIAEEFEFGCLLIDKDPETIHAALTPLMNPGTRKTMQENAYALHDQYNWDVAEERLLSLYKSLIGGAYYA